MKSGKLSLPGSEQFSLCTEGPRSTPQSPSPPRDILLTKPVTIPTEKVVTSTKGLVVLKCKQMSLYSKKKIYFLGIHHSSLNQPTKDLKLKYTAM